MRTPTARSLGMVTLALLLLLAVPGIVLALNYEPDAERAHDAVVAIDAGALRMSRGAHAWAASFLLGLALLHMARAYASDRMRVPSRGALLAGLGLLGVVVAAYFSGTILPWDQQGWEAYQHARRLFFLPENVPAEAPLGVLFYAHVLAVPVAVGAFLWYHLRRSRPRVDLARLRTLARATWVPIVGAVVLVGALAALAPPPLGPAPLAGVVVSRPDWPFLWLVPLQDAFGPIALWALPLLFLWGALAIGRAKGAEPGRRRFVLALLLGAFLFLTLLGAL